MKMTKKKVFYTVMEALLTGVAPLVFVAVSYCETDTGAGFKIGFAGILLAVLILLIFKRTVLRKYTEKLKTKTAQLETLLECETEVEKLKNAENALKRIRTVETVINAILPLLLLVGLLLLCGALEGAVIKLSGAVGFTVISFALGTVFAVLNAREVTKRKSENNDKDGREAGNE